MSQRRHAAFLGAGLAACLWTIGVAHETRAQDQEPAADYASRVERTNALDTLRAHLRLQEQLLGAQLALERSWQDAEAAAASKAEAAAVRLVPLEQSPAAQRAREGVAIYSSNRWLLVLTALFAGVGFVAILLTAYLLWRAANRLAAVAEAFPLGPAFGAGRATTAPGTGDAQVIAVGPVEQGGTPLADALERLEQRIHELEQIVQSRPPSPVPGQPDGDLKAVDSAPDGYGPSEHSDRVERVALLLGKAQALLNLDQPEDALACFDEALALDPAHAETLMKKGTTLERLERLDEAITCYDHAIAADRSLTIAYLHKGGVFNRLERYDDALKCYEQALRTQEKSHAA